MKGEEDEGEDKNSMRWRICKNKKESNDAEKEKKKAYIVKREGSKEKKKEVKLKIEGGEELERNKRK